MLLPRFTYPHITYALAQQVNLALRLRHTPARLAHSKILDKIGQIKTYQLNLVRYSVLENYTICKVNTLEDLSFSEELGFNFQDNASF